jgi:hypothetical protein
MGYELVGASKEDLRRQVPTQLTAKATLNSDGLEGEFIPTGRHIAAALLAGDHESLPISGHLEHPIMIGRYITRI